MNYGNTINLTKEQNECVNYSSGDLLVKGVAGSGKSVVILKRAKKLYRENGPYTSIAIFTYANTLVKYTDDILSNSIGKTSLKVQTVDSYCLKIYSNITGKRAFFLSDEEYRNLVRYALDKQKETTKINHRFFELDISFWEDEIRWIREKCISKRSVYVEADRRGRGSQIRMSRDDKEFAWDIYVHFFLKLRKQSKIDWPEIYIVLNENLNKIPDSFKFNYVLVDEAQDMTLGKMRVLKHLAKDSITIAADAAQKIYQTTFTWKEVGIDISGRASKSLNRPFRSTKQIVELAEDLMQVNRELFKGKLEYTEAMLPVEEGNKPIMYLFDDEIGERQYVIDYLYSISKTDKVVGVICRTSKDLLSIRKALYSKGVATELIDKRQPWSLLNSGIKFVTAHSSKGLEFDIVVIPFINSDRFPYPKTDMDDSQLEEYNAGERSLLYVAMTRARETLIMTCNEQNKSVFIGEFDKNHYNKGE